MIPSEAPALLLSAKLLLWLIPCDWLVPSLSLVPAEWLVPVEWLVPCDLLSAVDWLVPSEWLSPCEFDWPRLELSDRAADVEFEALWDAPCPAPALRLSVIRSASVTVVRPALAFDESDTPVETDCEIPVLLPLEVWREVETDEFVASLDVVPLDSVCPLDSDVPLVSDVPFVSERPTV